MSEMKDDESVGYGSPPKHSQFKKGQSGNPFGRPKSSVNRKTILEKIMAETASYREGETSLVVTKIELLLRTIRHQAAEGNLAALDLYEKLLGHVEPQAEQESTAILVTKRRMTEEEWEAKFGSVGDTQPTEGSLR